MFSELCPICGKVLETRVISHKGPIICYRLYECKDNDDHYYKLLFYRTDLLWEYFNFDSKKNNIYSICNDYSKKEHTVIFVGNDSKIKLPCYIGPNQLDKVKNYLMMV